MGANHTGGAEAGTAGPVVAVYDANPESYRALIEAVVPAERLRVCRETEQLAQCAADAEVLLAFKCPGVAFPRDVVVGLERLRWVQLAGAGIDHMVPFDSARIMVTNASGIHGSTMAEYVIASLVHLRWDFARLWQQQRQRLWIKYDVPSLHGLTMGIIGAGHVGGAIGRRAREFGMRVIGTRRTGTPIEGFDEVRGADAVAGVLGESDVVVLTLPLTSETRGMIGSRELRCCRPSAVLVNVSRGGIVNEDALAEVLRDGLLAGAILDVFEREPLPPDSPFWDMPNVLVTPHISSEFAGWREAVARLFLSNLERWSGRLPLLNVVDPVLGY